MNVDLITVIELEQWKSSVHGKLDDVEQLLDARDLIYNYLIDSQQKSPELKDYQLIGIDDLTEEMINFINQRLAESELDPTKDKLVDIRAEVASARQAYLDSKNSGGGALGWLMMSLLFLFRIRYFRVS